MTVSDGIKCWKTSLLLIDTFSSHYSVSLARKKSQIKLKYDKMHEVCLQAERYRARITHALNPLASTNLMYCPQPAHVPMLWYDMHNLETIVQQLFTPKLRTRTYYDENTHQLKMNRGFAKETVRKRFLPLPNDYLNDELADGDGHDVANFDIRKKGHTATGLELRNNKPTTVDHFNKDILEQYTYVLMFFDLQLVYNKKQFCVCYLAY